MKIICCAAVYGEGGLGRHLTELVEGARAAGELERYFAFAIPPGENRGYVVSRRRLDALLRIPPVRFSPGWKTHLTGEHFDRAVARRLSGCPQTLVCFAGQALHTFQRARAMNCGRLELVAANSHVNHLTRQHAKAAAQWKIEPSWLNTAQRRKMLQEYEMADLIHAASDYVLDSFMREGIPRRKLIKIPLHPNPRFTPLFETGHRADGPQNDVFRVVYVGSLTVAKGLPVLLEAFANLDDPLAELVLVGGTATRHMRKYLQRRMERDRRIRLAPGDPLPHLRGASVLVHPSYEDGFGYAPMEALACGVPAIVTDQTGMNEYIQEGVNGVIVPAGDVQALLKQLIHWKSRGKHLS